MQITTSPTFKSEESAPAAPVAIIEIGLMKHGWKFKFDDIDPKDKKNQSEIAEKYFKMGSLSINEVRTEFLGKQSIEGGDRHFIMAGNILIYIDTMEAHEVTESKELQKLKNEYDEILKELNAGTISKK